MPRPNRAAGHGPSQRQLRVGELIRHALADVLTRGEVPDPVLDSHMITVPEVRMSPDLKLATAFVMPLGGRDANPVVAALERQRRALRAAVAPRLELKFMPELRFRIDTSFEQGAKIDAILRSDEVRRDLDNPDEDEQAPAPDAAEQDRSSDDDR